jgi:5-formyltetrahydrofolate cyclo-ligase
MPPPKPLPKSLRTALRAARRSITAAGQRANARGLLRTLRRDIRFQRARRLGAYWATDGELDPRPALMAARQRGIRLFLPVLLPAFAGRPRQLRFAAYRSGESMRRNRYGIPEPRSRGRHLHGPRRLDLLLVPLVGFDAACNRIGMGGGYYDRTLAYLTDRPRGWRRPHLTGIAHECQRIAEITPQPWDVRLDAVATETRLYRAPTQNADSLGD